MDQSAVKVLCEHCRWNEAREENLTKQKEKEQCALYTLNRVNIPRWDAAVNNTNPPEHCEPPDNWHFHRPTEHGQRWYSYNKTGPPSADSVKQAFNQLFRP